MAGPAGAASSPPAGLPRAPDGAHPDLQAMVARLDRAGWAAEAYDADWRLIWMAEELKELLGEYDREKLGYGKHFFEMRLVEPWLSALTEESVARVLTEVLPYVMADTPGGKEAVVAMASAEWQPLLEPLEPAAPPPFWAWSFEFVQGDLPPAPGSGIALRGYGEDGSFMGTIQIYTPGLPASVLSLVARGDSDMFARMAALLEPGRRQAAILFADLQASGPLSRRLPSAAYFKLIQGFTTAIDDAVLRHKGIVGKHVGDGVTAFFLADDLGSDSGAARAAIEAAREISGAVEQAAAALGEETGVVDPADCLVNVGVHWGGNLYMGQLVTGGRLEVTALGDPVNEAARLQEAARDGAVLASKALVEQLSHEDAQALAVNPDSVAYRTVAEVPGAGEKAVRDAGSIPVAAL